ncbi:MAG: YwhD family protein [Candidatus Omnitrophica bacterium]|nr:YwhD family protein [Candidatus Omnitrophota bacterium]
MERTVPLSTGFGEVMAPKTLVTALIITPEGGVTLEPGALHGRSELESRLHMVPKSELGEPTTSHWIVWVAMELDQAEKPFRYQGLSVCEMLVNRERRTGHKSLAEHVNRMAEALRGGVNVAKLTPQHRSLVKQQLMTMSHELWERSAEPLKAALES